MDHPQAPMGSQVKQQRDPNAALTSLLKSVVDNYTTLPILIVEGVPFYQLRTLKTIHRYLNSQFEDTVAIEEDPLNQSLLNENNDDLYFYNIITPRNAHATKNIDIDRKNIMISCDSSSGMFFNFLLRNEIQRWMEDTGFGKLLNDLATNLPNFGKVIWKRCGEGDDFKITECDLRNCVFDPAAKTIYDSPFFLERCVTYPWEIMEHVGEGEEGGWNKEACVSLIRSAQKGMDKFIKDAGSAGGSVTQYSVSDASLEIDVWEGFGWFEKSILSGDDEDKEVSDEEAMEYVYAKVVVGGLDSGSIEVLFIEEAEEEDFNYKEFNWFRRVPGRCLPISNTEALIRLQVQMNELMNEVMKCLRNGSLQLFQAARPTAYQNLLQDAMNGDLIISKDPITSVPFEMRSFPEYSNMFTNILGQADMICNTPDIVTGESMPTNTPFRLGAQLGVSANKIFDQVREDCGMVISDVFREWVLPEMVEQMTEEHILEVSGSVEELKMFDEKVRELESLQSVKKYILQTNRLPSAEQMDLVNELISEGKKDKAKKVKIEKGFFTMENIKAFRLYFDVSDERKDFVGERESLTTLLGMIQQNPAVLESEEGRILTSKIMSYSNIDPIILAALASKPKPKAQVNQPVPPGQEAPAEKIAIPNPQMA